MGKRVLITSYTHSAVDNVMLKLIEKGVARRGPPQYSKLIRIGRQEICHQDVAPILHTNLASQQHGKQKDNVDDLPTADALEATVSQARIVGVTALSIPRSPLLVGQAFDVVIVDEAGQISQPAILGALMAADTFVLVGDHKQLPPLVVSDAAEKAGKNINDFFLSVHSLNVQFIQATAIR